MTVDTGVTPYVIGEFGAGLALMGLVVALVFWTKRFQIHAADRLMGLTYYGFFPNGVSPIK